MRNRRYQKQRVRTKGGHDRAAKRRADNGADAVKQKQSARDFDEIFRGGEVVGVCDRDRVERIGCCTINTDHSDPAHRHVSGG